MTKVFRFLVICTVTLLVCPLSAQIESDTERDNKNTPNQNSIFNGLGKKKKDGASGTDVDIKNNLGFCPTMLFRQKIFFLYERKVHDILLLNIGLGKAFGNDGIQAIYFEAFDDYTGTRQLAPGQILLNSTYEGSSLLLHLGIKIFFSGEAFDGGFFEFNYRRERLDFKMNPTMLGYKVENGTTAEFSMNALSFGYGYKAVNNRLTHEFFLSFGLKNFNYTQYNEMVRGTSNGSSEIVYQRSTQRAKARILPAINMGYIFGFGW